MRRFSQIVSWLVIAMFLLHPSRPAAAQDTGEARLLIETPATGEAVQGLVQISVAITDLENSGGSLAFRYSDQPEANWFTIWRSDEPLKSGVLTVWDTTTISDGTYDLVLQVQFAGGELGESLNPGIRVRNYTPVETSTPEPTQTEAPGRTITPTKPAPTIQPTTQVISLPDENPASLNEGQVFQTMLIAGIVVVAVFLIVGIYFGIGTIIKRRR